MEPQEQSLAAAGMPQEQDGDIDRGPEGTANDQQQDQMKQMVMKVVQLLMAGKSPEELLKMGVPKEVIQMAIQIIQQQQAQQGQQQTGGEPSLAASGM